MTINAFLLRRSHFHYALFLSLYSGPVKFAESSVRCCRIVDQDPFQWDQDPQTEAYSGTRQHATARKQVSLQGQKREGQGQ